LPAAVVTPVPVPVFGMTPRAFLPLMSASTQFTTLPPGSVLPSGAECATRVKRQPENKRVNALYNATPGSQQLASDFFGGSDPRANTEIAVRVTGAFTGTTDEILQWAACKWGIDPDMVRAQAAVESWWRQSAKGDWGADPDRCPDTAYAVWRACYEGYEWWLNEVERGQDYAPGDAWGCVGRWYAGRWRTAPAEAYIARVKDYLTDRVWEQAYFQEP
jgi:hypothetical protein